MASAPSKSNPNVARAGVIMMLSLLLSRILGLVRDAIITGKFGGSGFTDAYFQSFKIPDLLFFLIAGGALSSAFIPVFSEYLHTEREREAWHIFSVVTTFMSILVVGFIVLAWIFAYLLSHMIAPGTSDAFIPYIVQMSRIVLPAQFAFFIGGIMFGTLYANHRFSVPGLGPNVYNLGIIVGAVVISGFVTPGVVGMSWGALGGAFLGNIVIPYLAMRQIGVQFKPSLDLRHPGVRQVFRLMLPVVLGLSLPGVYALIMSAFGSYYGKGMVTYLDISNKLMQAPLGIFGQSLAIAVFPALTQFFALKQMDRYRNQLGFTMRTVIYLTVPITALMFFMAPQIVGAVYQHGKFTADDAAVTAQCLRYFSIGITAWCLHPVLMRAFFAIQNTVTPIALGTATTGLFVGLIYLLQFLGMDYRALPLAGSISAIALILALAIAVAPRIGGLEIRPLVETLMKSLVGAIPLALLAIGVGYTSFGQHIASHKFQTLGVVLGVFLLGAWSYYFVTRALGMKESEYLNRAMNRRAKRAEPVSDIEAGGVED
ncbi:MAG TPA: murein biosynthesis integral membrane protein MurJ [Fimbriimonadaceae bacterium]|nr:murein biosynthesis integral membrane protein MurJ [Fimbriimonadaceae bacterium]